ncbi:MAG TPA: type II secretion system protein [Candidatus Paceibacterota bacterium]|nr:type II secretion system protein [Candidatus Paceibacterota bacterium]
MRPSLKTYNLKLETSEKTLSFWSFTLHASRSKIRGFTLIEMIVSIGIFTIVMLMATSTIFTVVAANNKAQSLKLVMDNLDFALDSMVREIRVGTNYSCPDSPSNCSSGDTQFTFTSSDTGNPSITYSLSGAQIMESSGETSLPITAPNITIQSLKFYLVGTPGSIQPRVLITVGGTSGSGTSASTFNIQTTVSERQIGS